MQERKLELKVSGMRCGGCVAAVKAAVGRVPGVTRVEVDLATGKVTVWGDAAGDAIAAAVAGAGYQAEVVPPEA
ncbi:MAG TPA: heavy metal-associated domain-containing protein [Bacillota bacterium]|nr:heavy metal-associated domain-containing protein [Bacillota bacterium]